jgi:hypothetical protein
MAVEFAHQVTLKGSDRSISCQYPHAKGLVTGFKILEMQKRPLPDKFKHASLFIRSTMVRTKHNIHLQTHNIPGANLNTVSFLFLQTKDKFGSTCMFKPRPQELGNVLGHCTFSHSTILNSKTVDEPMARKAGLSLQNMRAAIRAGYCNAW